MMRPEAGPSQMHAAMAELKAAYGMLAATGAVDSEPEVLRKLEEDLTSGKIEPDEAVKRVRGMLDARQNYH